MKTILVVGATGSVGQEVIQLLANEKDIIVHAGSRHPNDFTDMDNISYIPFDYSNLALMSRAIASNLG